MLLSLIIYNFTNIHLDPGEHEHARAGVSVFHAEIVRNTSLTVAEFMPRGSSLRFRTLCRVRPCILKTGRRFAVSRKFLNP